MVLAALSSPAPLPPGLPGGRRRLLASRRNLKSLTKAEQLASISERRQEEADGGAAADGDGGKEEERFRLRPWGRKGHI